MCHRGRVRNTELRPALRTRGRIQPATRRVVRAVIANLGLVACLALAGSRLGGPAGRATQNDTAHGYSSPDQPSRPFSERARDRCHGSSPSGCAVGRPAEERVRPRARAWNALIRADALTAQPAGKRHGRQHGMRVIGRIDSISLFDMVVPAHQVRHRPTQVSRNSTECGEVLISELAAAGKPVGKLLARGRVRPGPHEIGQACGIVPIASR